MKYTFRTKSLGLLCLLFFSLCYGQQQNVVSTERSLQGNSELPKTAKNSLIEPGMLDRSITERLETLKENIKQLQLEQKRIEALITSTKAANINTSTNALTDISETTNFITNEKLSEVNTSITLPTKNASDARKSKPMPITTKKIIVEISQEEAERQLFLKQMQKTSSRRIENNVSKASEGEITSEDHFVPNRNSVLNNVNSTSELITNPDLLLVNEIVDSNTTAPIRIHRVYVKLVAQEEAEKKIRLERNEGSFVDDQVVSHVPFNQKVLANFNGDNDSFYAHISKVDPLNECTTIFFSKPDFKPLIVPKTFGGSVTALKLDGNDRDFLLFKAKIDDSEFYKYHLYVLRDNKCKPVMNGFAIHKSNERDVPFPVRIDPDNPNQLLRYYSVFDLDVVGTSLNPWRLVEESVLMTSR